MLANVALVCNNMLTRFADIGWNIWTPHKHATLLFVREADRVLLIRQKCGHGGGQSLAD